MTKLLPAAFMFLLLTLGMPAAVLSADPAAGETVTTSDPAIPQDDLKLKLKPLMRAELKAEADAWLHLLEDKVKEISTAEIAVKDKLREISAAEEVETTLDGVDEARQKAGASLDGEEAKNLIRDAEQAYDAALEEARAAVEKVKNNAETARATAKPAALAEENAAAAEEDATPLY
jgi:small conductance mechanosensitive channel